MWWFAIGKGGSARFCFAQSVEDASTFEHNFRGEFLFKPLLPHKRRE